MQPSRSTTFRTAEDESHGKSARGVEIVRFFVSVVDFDTTRFLR